MVLQKDQQSWQALTKSPEISYTKKRREKTWITINVNESGDIITNLTESKRIIRVCYSISIVSNKFDNLHEMDKFLKTYKLPKLNKEEILKISSDLYEIKRWNQ